MTRSMTREVHSAEIKSQRTRSLSPMRFQSVDIDPIWSSYKTNNQSNYQTNYESITSYRKSDCMVAKRTPESTPLPSRTLQEPLSSLTASVSSASLNNQSINQSSNQSTMSDNLSSSDQSVSQMCHSPISPSTHQSINQTNKSGNCSRAASSRTRTCHVNESFSQCSSPRRSLNQSTKRSISQCYSPFNQSNTLSNHQSVSQIDSPLCLGMKRSLSERMCTDDEGARVRANLRSQSARPASPLVSQRVASPVSQSNNQSTFNQSTFNQSVFNQSFNQSVFNQSTFSQTNKPNVSPFSSPLNSPFQSPLSSPMNSPMNQSSSRSNNQSTDPSCGQPTKRARFDSFSHDSDKDDEPALIQPVVHQYPVKHSIFMSPFSSPASNSDNTPSSSSDNSPTDQGDFNTPQSGSRSLSQSARRSINLSIVLPSSPSPSTIHSPLVRSLSNRPIYQIDDQFSLNNSPQPYTQPSYQTINQSISQSNNQSSNQSINQSNNQSNNQSHIQSVSKSNNHVQYQSKNPVIQHPIGQTSADRWYYQLQLKKQQAINQSSNQSINQSNNQLTNQSIQFNNTSNQQSFHQSVNPAHNPVQINHSNNSFNHPINNQSITPYDLAEMYKYKLLD